LRACAIDEPNGADEREHDQHALSRKQGEGAKQDRLFSILATISSGVPFCARRVVPTHMMLPRSTFFDAAL
jgi:hypothetical protein